METETPQSYRIIFGIVALAWLVIAISLLIEVVRNPGGLALFSTLLGSAAAVGAIAAFYFKSWGAILYVAASFLFLIRHAILWAAGNEAATPTELIMVIALFFAGGLAAKDEFLPK